MFEIGEYRAAGRAGGKAVRFLVRRDHPMPRAALEALVGELAFYEGPKPPPNVRLQLVLTANVAPVPPPEGPNPGEDRLSRLLDGAGGKVIPLSRGWVAEYGGLRPWRKRRSGRPVNGPRAYHTLVGVCSINFGAYRLPGQRGPRPTPFLYLADCPDPRAALEVLVGELATPTDRNFPRARPRRRRPPRARAVRRRRPSRAAERSPGRSRISGRNSIEMIEYSDMMNLRVGNPLACVRGATARACQVDPARSLRDVRHPPCLRTVPSAMGLLATPGWPRLLGREPPGLWSYFVGRQGPEVEKDARRLSAVRQTADNLRYEAVLNWLPGGEAYVDRPWHWSRCWLPRSASAWPTPPTPCSR